jgi:methylated-DNA-[protein]-cysteine S-methyltransferase
LGWLRLRGEGAALLALDYLTEPLAGTPLSNDLPLAAAWLAAYFSAQTLPALPALKPAGTLFQQRVWSALLSIPVGSVITYGELARRVESSPRAVGGALRANPIPVLIPCHRVVALSGLGGYAGASEAGQVRKRWLLAHEGCDLK